MAPFVPDIIGNELNLIVALLIGIAFGFILEQAGFSSSKKLVGLFYGYDFTVLRVFFTAGVTAMLGIITLSYFRLLDINLIYINPTYIWSAVIGGFIMGLGFVLGGYCPGTSFCGAAIGKIDGMIFIGGGFLGVLLFSEGYPLFENLFKAGFWGSPRIFETIGVSQSLFAFLLTTIAVLAFIITTKIENKVNKRHFSEFQPACIYAGLVILAVIIGLSAFMMPDRQTEILKNSSDVEMLNSFKPAEMSIDEFAFRIIDNDKRLQIFDFRNTEAFVEMSFPNSMNFTFENLFGKDTKRLLTLKKSISVFVADDEETEKRAAYIASGLGYDNILILQGGLSKFKQEIINFSTLQEINSRRDADIYRFREKASKIIPEILLANKNKGVKQKKESKRVLGGC